jgi:hypothetical protein
MIKKYAMNVCNAMKEGVCSVNSESEFSVENDCYSDVVMKVFSGSEQSDSSDDDEDVNNDIVMQHGTWANVGASDCIFYLVVNLV